MSDDDSLVARADHLVAENQRLRDELAGLRIQLADERERSRCLGLENRILVNLSKARRQDRNSRLTHCVIAGERALSMSCRYNAIARL